MTEFIITSSVLILVVILLRHFLKGKISLHMQYALWALVLIRLIVPINLFESPISVMNTIERSAVYKTAEQTLLRTQVYSDVIFNSEMTPDEASKVGKGTLHEIQGYPIESGYAHLHTYIFMDSLGTVLARILRTVWLAGVAIVGLTLLFSNLSFNKKLRKTRIRYQINNCKRPVYLVKNLPSPCLYGFFNPVIYITPNVADDTLKLRHVLAHEQTHYRHGDHIWAALRGLCLVVHWYNPLVWLAATLSRRDSELACDEGTIKQLGEASRLEYGRTIIDLTCEKRKTMDLLCCATSMTDEKKGIKERVTLIARKPKVLVPALVTAVLVATVAVGCTFTGSKFENAEIIPLTADEVEIYNKVFDPMLYDEHGNPIGINPLNQFLTSYYDRPEDINLAELLRYFPSDGDVKDEAEFESLKASESWPFGADATLASMPVPIHRFTAETINDTLEKYMGIMLDDLSGVGMDELIYLNAYNAYYNFTSDAGFGSFVCLSGEKQGDIIRLYSEHAILTLKKQGDGFIIVSHQPIGDGANNNR